MTEEPYRWLEAMGNRREYVLNQVKGGSPVFAVSLEAGVLLLGVGSGQSKVFEIFDRHALAGLGHPADLERVRQMLIDAAHLEAFTRAPEDVTLRRLVSFNLSPQIKTVFEQLFAPPFLVRLLLSELGATRDRDSLIKVQFDGTYSLAARGLAVVAADPADEAAVEDWLTRHLPATTEPGLAIDTLLLAWRHLAHGDELPEGDLPTAKPDLAGLEIEAALLRRSTMRVARFETIPAR